MTEQATPPSSAPRVNGRLDAGALGALFDRHGSLAYGLAMRLTGDPARAEDVVCDAFLRLARSPEAFEADGARRRVVAMVAAAAMRSRRSLRQTALPEGHARSR